jgi:hypothetical protein
MMKTVFNAGMKFGIASETPRNMTMPYIHMTKKMTVTIRGKS